MTDFAAGFVVGQTLARLETKIDNMEDLFMTALDDARVRLDTKIDVVLTIARELRDRINQTEDTTADTAALNAKADELDAAIDELSTEAQNPPVDTGDTGGGDTGGGTENPPA